jgi:purine-binding chemotaxis protein CheW
MSDEVFTREVVVFGLGAEEYALPIGCVQEIIRYTEPRSVASSVAWVRGVISLRGKIVPVYDLAARLGCIAAQDPAEGKIVIVEVAGETAGVIADDVTEVLSVAVDQIERVPTAGVDAIESIVKLGDRLILLLDLTGLLGRPAEVAA